MLNKDTAATIEEIASSTEIEEYEDIKFYARDMATRIDRNGKRDNMLWIMCLRLTAQILVDAQKRGTGVAKYLASDKFFT